MHTNDTNGTNDTNDTGNTDVTDQNRLEERLRSLLAKGATCDPVSSLLDACAAWDSDAPLLMENFLVMLELLSMLPPGPNEEIPIAEELLDVASIEVCAAMYDHALEQYQEAAFLQFEPVRARILDHFDTHGSVLPPIDSPLPAFLSAVFNAHIEAGWSSSDAFVKCIAAAYSHGAMDARHRIALEEATEESMFCDCDPCAEFRVVGDGVRTVIRQDLLEVAGGENRAVVLALQLFDAVTGTDLDGDGDGDEMYAWVLDEDVPALLLPGSLPPEEIDLFCTVLERVFDLEAGSVDPIRVEVCQTRVEFLIPGEQVRLGMGKIPVTLLRLC